jgi:hypothetical protein
VVSQLGLEQRVVDVMAPLVDQGFETVVDSRKLSAGDAVAVGVGCRSRGSSGLNEDMDQFMSAAIDED